MKGGTVHVGDGRTFDDGAVGFRNGTIDYVGYGYGVKAVYDTVIPGIGNAVWAFSPNTGQGVIRREQRGHAGVRGVRPPRHEVAGETAQGHAGEEVSHTVIR